ncbi:hypothetical protein [Luteolibacter sp. LG18]|uniref:hypothetical protein n=1 Tax=Luteolibacter sp. LG18 TaxID=2819286 RepID=UPI002B2BEA17|nr:hypothetical protein llg_26290 [Luteolibacter sp. LG18]
MRLLLRPLALWLLVAPFSQGKDSLKMLEAFWKYDCRQMQDGGRDPAPVRLDALLADEEHGVIEGLQTLSAVRRERGVAAIAGLEKLKAMHRARTFKVLFPDDWQEVKAQDFEQRFCDRIDALVMELRAEAHEVPKPAAPVAPADLARAAAEFEAAVKQADFSPSPTLDKRTRASEQDALRLLMALREGKVAADSAEAKAVAAAIRTALAKLDAAVVENYQWQPVMANVAPPAGTPNAAAGMSPMAIDDPGLRRKYLEAIAENQAKSERNQQQSSMTGIRGSLVLHVSGLEPWASAAGLSKEELATRFTAEGKSRELLRERLGLAKGKNPAKK